MRFISFFPYVIDHDESTYIIIANQWLQGELPYVDHIDVKPIGIYIVFAVLLKLFKSVWIIRVAAAIAIGLTAYYLNKASAHFFDRTVGHQVGLIYVFLASLHKWSWSANTETFFILFSVIGLYYFTIAKKTREYLTIGLLFGIGFLFKYHILFELAAFSIFFILLAKIDFLTKLKRSCLICIGLALPIGITLLSYAVMGFFGEIWNATYHIPGRYLSTYHLGESLSFMGEFYLSFLPFSLLFFAGLILAVKHRKNNVIFFSTIWLLLSWLGILITGKNYFHYYFQALPCLCFFLPFFTAEVSRTRFGSFLGSLNNFKAILILLACLVTNLNQYIQLSGSPRYLNEVVQIVGNELSDNDLIYTNHENILYFLLDVSPPTKYTHTSLIYKSDLAQSFGIDPKREIRRIVAQKPKFYLFRGEVPDGFVFDVETHCTKVETFGTNLNLYRRDGNQ